MNLTFPISRLTIVACVILLAFSSCKPKKILADGTLNDKLPAKTIIKTHYQNGPNFKTLSGKMRIDYSDGEDSQGVSVSLRMEKDKAIWISAPFGVVKALITPGRVSFYNKLENEYFDGDFAYLSKYLGTELDFEQIQNLLTGQALLDLNEGKYNVSVSGKNYQLKPKQALDLYKILFQIDPENFRMASQQLSQPEKKRLLQINYSDYSQMGKYLLPQRIAIAAIDDSDRSTVDLQYRSIEFDRLLSFPYNIPNGYDRIILEDNAK